MYRERNVAQVPNRDPRPVSDGLDRRDRMVQGPLFVVEAAPEPAEEVSSGEKHFVYRVYGGQTSTRESAEKLKGDLGALGLSGTIIKNGGEYLVLVREFTDFNSAFSLTNQLQNGGFQAACMSQVETN